MPELAKRSTSAKLPRIDPSSYPLLDEKQVGSIRHIANLARQLKNDWSNMMGPTPGSEDFGAYRHQLAYMSYGLALGHCHRLPAAPGVFRQTFDNLIQKMLLPDVWYEWRDTSKAGGAPNNYVPMTDARFYTIVREPILYG